MGENQQELLGASRKCGWASLKLRLDVLKAVSYRIYSYPIDPQTLEGAAIT